MKLDLGAGKEKYQDYQSIDLYDPEADIKADASDLSEIKSGTVEEMVAFQLIEHVPYNRTTKMFKEWHRVLKPGGWVWIECPDIEYIAKKILEGGLKRKWVHNLWGEYHRPWDKERYDDWKFAKAAQHVHGFTSESLLRYLEEAGFEMMTQITKTSEKHSQYPECLSIKAFK